MKRLWLLLAVLCAATGAVAGAALLSGGALPLLFPAGPVALAERHVILLTFALSGLVVLPVFGALFFFAWRYRAEGPAARQAHAPNWDHDSPLAEFSWWLVPSLIILALAVLAWQSAHQLDPYTPLPGGAPLTVDVVALDWKWLFLYPAQGVASVNRLVIPAGVPVTFELTADAPMNSFWIPALGGQIMVMPGMLTQLNLEASRAGSYPGFSANISGEGFSGMAFEAEALPPADFAAWAASASSSVPLDYPALAAPSENVAPATYAGLPPGLLDSIMMSYMAPASTTP
ncbi:MAG TPA: COX aromatic rich motif-containing protein [Candidatus Paceibacterota bacterium]|nr:COX aromatic rich motif-containing protein [Candidatus Paceibacterota bacterium]